MPKSSRFASARAVVAASILLVAAAAAGAQDEAFRMPRALRVCDDPNNLPFSNDRAQGFENRIVELLAAELKLPLEYFHYPQRVNVVRNTIRYKRPGDVEYRCDLLPGVPADFGAVAATRPYFRSTYVLVYVKGRKLDIASAEDLVALDAGVRSSLKIGIYDRTPATQWLLKHGMIEQAVPYRILNADPTHYPGRIIDHDLVEGKIDAAIVWGPIGGYFAKRVKGAELAVIPLRSEAGVRFDYGVAMGVRRDEPEWLSLIQQALDARREDVLRVLREYDVPLVDEEGLPLP